MAGRNLLLPRDQDGNAIPLSPKVASLATTINASISSATSVTLDTNTSIIEVQATGANILMKYAAGVTTANNGWDERILDGQVRHYVIPGDVTTISFIQEAATATLGLIQKG